MTTLTEPAATPAAPPPIVVGVDGSDCARHAVTWAASMARAQGRGLELVYAERPGGGGPAPTVAAEAERLTAAGVPTRVEVVAGEPGQVLVRRSVDAELLVLGAWGRSSRVGLLLGSVAQHCARHSRCPLVLVPLPPDDRLI